MCTQKYGVVDYRFLIALQDLAACYAAQSKGSEAQLLYKQAYCVCCEKYGASDYRTVKYMKLTQPEG